MNRTKAFLLGILSSNIQKILIKLIGLFVTPIILYYLNKTEYGIWITIGSILGYIGLMDFGISGAIISLISKLENKKEINIILSNAFYLQIFLGLFIIILGFIFSFYFPDVFNIENFSSQKAGLVLLLASIGYGIGMPIKSLKGFIKARQMIALNVWLEFLIFLLTTSLNLLLLYMKLGLMALPISTILIRLLVSFPLFIYFAKRIFPELNINFKYVSFKRIKSIFNVSIFWFISILAAMIIYSTDNLVIGSILSVSIVTSYALTFRLTEVIREFVYSIDFNLMPGIGQLIGKKELFKVKNIFLQSQTFILNITIIASFFIVLFNKYFVKVWVGEKYYAGDSLSLIFALILFVSVVFHSSSIVLSLTHYIKKIAFIRLFEGLLNIILSVYLIKKLGLIGVALGTLIASVITSFWYVPYHTSKFLNITFSDWYKKVLKNSIIVFIINLSILLLSNIYSNFFVNVLIFVFVNILLLFYVLDDEIKRMIYGKFKK